MTAPARAMILAAGRGSRLRPVTDRLPKPLVSIHGQTLLGARLTALAAAGVTDVVINVAWLGQMIVDAVGDGSAWGLSVRYSDEGDAALETGGGIARALPLLGDAPFIVCNADVWTDHRLATLVEQVARWPDQQLAHLVLVDNPPWRAQPGEFDLTAGTPSGVLRSANGAFTLSGIEALHPALFDPGFAPGAPSRGAFRLTDRLWPAIESGRVGGERLTGRWSDIGTPERLAQARAA